MQRAKLCLAAACMLATATTRLSAQGFNGVIQFVSYEDHADQPDTMTQITKGSKIRFEGMGKGGGAMIMDGDQPHHHHPREKKYMDAARGVRRQGGRGKESTKHHGNAAKTGKTETIAGIPCEDWHYKGTKDDGKPEEGDVCMAKGAGLMINRLSAAWSTALLRRGRAGVQRSDEKRRRHHEGHRQRQGRLRRDSRRRRRRCRMRCSRRRRATRSRHAGNGREAAQAVTLTHPPALVYRLSATRQSNRLAAIAAMPTASAHIASAGRSRPVSADAGIVVVHAIGMR